MAVIETKDLTKSYGKSRGIIDVSLAVEEGDFFGFIGPNGAGKSTTIRTLLGLISPTSGTAHIFGKDVTKDTRAILKDIGYMPSEAMFYSTMRVEETIKYAAQLFGGDYSTEAHALCDRFDVDPKKKIEDLSLGNRRKVSIVCALQHKPKLLILDEPSSGLDPLMQKEFFDLLVERNDSGATIFLSSHVLSEVQKFCLNAAIVREGKIIANSSVAKLSETNARRVTLIGVNQAPNLPGLIDVRSNKDHVSFLYTGEMPTLITALQGLPLKDVSITEPSLDEIFLHFYEKDGGKSSAKEGN